MKKETETHFVCHDESDHCRGGLRTATGDPEHNYDARPDRCGAISERENRGGSEDLVYPEYRTEPHDVQYGPGTARANATNNDFPDRQEYDGRREVAGGS